MRLAEGLYSFEILRCNPCASRDELLHRDAVVERVIGRNTPTRAVVAHSSCNTPSATVDFPVSPSGDAMYTVDGA